MYDEENEWKTSKGDSQMEEKDFEVLRVLNDTRSITQAAEKLYMTQSALSRRLRTIEEELGAELVVRSRQGVRFTPAGEMALCRE